MNWPSLNMCRLIVTIEFFEPWKHWQLAFKSGIFLLWLLAGMNGSLIAQADSTQSLGTDATLIRPSWGGNCYATDAGFAFGFLLLFMCLFPFQPPWWIAGSCLSKYTNGSRPPEAKMFPLAPRDLVGTALPDLKHTLSPYDDRHTQRERLPSVCRAPLC